MKRDNLNYVIAGGVVLAAFLGLLITLYAIMGRTGQTDGYHVYYTNVSGMKYGTLVFYEGYGIGQVESVTPEHTPAGTRYKVSLTVTADWPIRVGSIARVSSSGLISANHIEIQAGTGDGLLQPGAELLGESRVDILGALTDAANDFRVLSRESLKPLAESLDVELTALVKDLRSVTSEGIRPIIAAISKQVDDPKLFEDLRSVSAGAAAISAQLEELLAPENVKRINSSLSNVTVLSGELVQTNRAAHAFLDEDNRTEVKTALRSVGRVAQSLESASSTVERVLNEKNRQHVEETLANAESATAEIRNLTAGLNDTRADIDALIASVDRTVTDNQQPLTGAVGDLRKTLRAVSQRAGAFSHHLEGASRNMHEFTRQIREHPGLLISGQPQRAKRRGAN